MTSETKELQSTFETDSSDGKQNGDEANSPTNDHEKQNVTDGSMVNIPMAAEEEQCSPGRREPCRERATNSPTNDHEEQNATDGSMVNTPMAAEEEQCSPGSGEPCWEMACVSDLGTDQQDIEVKSSEEERNSTTNCNYGCYCTFCLIFSGSVLVAVGIGTAVLFLYTTLPI